MLNLCTSDRTCSAMRNSDTPRLLHHYFERQVRRRPRHSAVEFMDERVTYAQLDRAANKIANYLITKGLRPGSLVGIFLKKSPRLYAVMLGILKAGCGYVPIDPKFPLDRIQSITDDAQLAFMISEGELADTLEAELSAPLLRLDRIRAAIAACSHGRIGRRFHGSERSSLCYVIYTSGSTGRPKGVMIEHRNAVAFVRTLESVYRISQNDRVYQGFSTAFDASVEEIWAAFSLGGTLVVPTEDVERSPLDVADFINSRRITYFSTVPTMLAMVSHELPTVRTLVLGGEACSNELVSRWAKGSRRMLNTYGPTEATVVATWAECVAGRPVTIGRALPGYSTYVLDDFGTPVKPGDVGELYIGGAGVGRGYRHLDELTSQRFIPNPFDPDGKDRLYRTSDLVRLGEDGELHFLGRLDDQIKIRGFRIELSEIEAVLLEFPMIKAAAVGVTEVSQVKELAAYVVCSPGGERLDRERLSDWLRLRLPPYMIPQYLDILSQLPMMPSGKIDRKRLPAPQSLLKGMGSIVAATDDLEKAIVETWQQAFKLPNLSVEADFFLDLGGHSLLAAQCTNLFRAAHGEMSMSVRDIYDNRTVRQLANALRKRGDVRLSNGKTDQGDDVDGEKILPSQAALNSVPAWVRWITVSLQAVAVLIYYAIIAAPLAYVTIMISAVLDGTVDWLTAASISTIIGFAAWPSLLLFSIAVKWIVVGRYKPGRYPVWGFYYLRWWVASRFQSLSWAEMCSGTPLMAWYWRAMGAKVGRNVTICTPLCTAFDVVSIGDDTSIGLETQILGYRVEDGHLIIGQVSIGRQCFVGMHCNVGLDTSLRDGARLDDMSLLNDGQTIPPNEGWSGSPARLARVVVPGMGQGMVRPSRARRAAFAVLHLLLIYAMGYFLIAVSIPSLALIVGGLVYWGPAGGVAGAFAGVPVGLLSFAIGAIGVTRSIGRLEAGTMPIHSFRYLKHWFMAYLLENTKHILMPLYATVFLPSLLRALGAKVGKASEISTVSHITPDLLEIGSGSFLADACIVGGHRVNGGFLEVGAVRIGERSFIGNSALVSGGRSIGRNVLIGVASTPPAGIREVPDNTAWLGSPSFPLPRAQNESCFANDQTFAPNRSAVIERTLTDAFRVVLPGLFLAATAVLFVILTYAAYHSLPLWAALASIPFAALALAVVAVVASGFVKEVFSGTLSPVVKPLWCRFVWHNELVNGFYENVAAPAMGPLMGTPFLAPCLRLMGCDVGKWCFLETTLFSEFDLVHIGDRASLNLGSTIQTHLFEDRVFKAEHLHIANDCSVGNMAVVLYGTQMQSGSVLGPLSVLMKGETLAQGTRWHGIPSERVRPLQSPKAAAAAAKKSPLSSPSATRQPGGICEPGWIPPRPTSPQTSWVAGE